MTPGKILTGKAGIEPRSAALAAYALTTRSTRWSTAAVVRVLTQ